MNQQQLGNDSQPLGSPVTDDGEYSASRTAPAGNHVAGDEDVEGQEPVLVIGVGNPYRRDDGFGVVVLNRLGEQPTPGLLTVEESGESAALISRWSGHPFVIMVDAVSSGAEPGTIHRLECGDGKWNVPARSSQASTHGLGVANAVELGTVLNQLPERLVIFGVETADVSNGSGLTAKVAAAVDVVVAKIVAEAHTAPSHQGRGQTDAQAVLGSS
jgi:hydrogenase maturation protease